MRAVAAILAVLLLTGCAGTVDTVRSWVPSFWDDNQSQSIIDIRLSAQRIQCDSEQIELQVQAVRDHIDWFVLYSTAKGWQQADVLRLVDPISDTVAGLETRIQSGKFSAGYCKIKLKTLDLQTERAAATVLGRY